MSIRMTRNLIAALLLLVSLASSQTPCLGDDGFNIGCCNPVTAVNLPAFPPLQMAATYGCLKDCALEAQLNVGMLLSAPTMITCDYAIANLSVTSAGGPNFGGVVLMKYARTWMEAVQTPIGIQQRQVWRFLINTDANFSITSATATPCPVPLAALPPLNQPIHMVGSVEYVANCGPIPVGTPLTGSLNLTHVGCLNHEVFSQRPLTGPPAAVDRVYALVAPANFVFNVVPEPAGQIVAESVRSSQIAPGLPYVCFGEQRLGQGQLQTQFQDCYTCGSPVPGVVPAWAHQTFAATGVCASGIATPMNGVPIAPWFPTGVMALSLGNWTGIAPGTFPGNRTLHVYYGVLQYTDPCSAGFPFHLVTGVGNNFTDPARLFGGPPGLTANQFIDLQNMLVLDPASATFVPGLGEIFLSSTVWNMNTL